MEFSRSILDIIQERTSWRTYASDPIPAETLKDLTQHFTDPLLTGPFNSEARLRFEIFSFPEINPAEKRKLGTYGLISGAHTFIVGAINKFKYAWVAYGYAFEWIILKATDLGLGTCWLGGTFNRSEFAERIQLKEEEWLPAISPLGLMKDRTLKERVIRWAVKAKNRKPWLDMFMYNTFTQPLTPELADVYKTPLKMVRLGPSTANLQPWRILLDSNTHQWHFYLTPRTPQSHDRFTTLFHLDIGIAMCHFELACRQLNLPGTWQIYSQSEIPNIPSLQYIISWNTQM